MSLIIRNEKLNIQREHEEVIVIIFIRLGGIKMYV